MKNILLLTLIVFVSSCANVPQIERGRHATRVMQLDPIPHESVFINEVESFREASAGGSAAVGGGCGCN